MYICKNEEKLKRYREKLIIKKIIPEVVFTEPEKSVYESLTKKGTNPDEEIKVDLNDFLGTLDDGTDWNYTELSETDCKVLARQKIYYSENKGAWVKVKPSNDDTSALERQKRMEIAEKEFLHLMEQSHDLTRAVLREYERNLWRMGHQLKNTTGNMQMERKIAAKLWKLGRDFGVDTEDGVMIDIDLTITLMADLVGAPRENVSRACKVLTDRGLIHYGNKRFTLIDFEGLAEFYKM